MAASLNYYLTELAKTYFIKYDSNERTKITNSLSNLKKQLKNEFDTDIKEIIEFGSYKRDTILPRRIDEESDIDLMIVFNHEEMNVRPVTYREYLHDFADDYYSSSISYKDQPSVVLELSNIKYDLVPAYQETGWFSSTPTTYIPESNDEWMETNPNGFAQELTEKNGNNNSIIKPIIRLMKAWNSKAGYPFDSFSFEKDIVNMWFYSDTVESGFFRVIGNLSTWQDSDFISNKVRSLQSNASRVKEALDNNNEQQAKNWLAHILPIN